MTIPEQAVQAALDKWRDHELDGTLDNPRMRAALTAAAPYMSAPAREQALEEAATLIDEGFDKAVGKSWRNDGKPGKNDRCPHGKFMYEDCERCASDAIRALKSQPPQTGGGDE